jgi:hypothetical protein
MRDIAKLQDKDREALFRNTAQKMGMNEAIVEKDFWVCWTLDYLFHQSKWKKHFAFKGGTSLSKGYRLIKRFSEDIDLILDWRLLGYDEAEPYIERSHSKQDLFIKEANERAERFLDEAVLPVMRQNISDDLGVFVKIYIDKADPQTIRFVYPQSFSDQAILQEIRLEIGTLASWTPASPLPITPYAAEYYPKLFSKPSTVILTVAPERTFWEKVTILHREANRNTGAMPMRYSRHYYDLFCIAASDVKQKALSDLELLSKVAAFKSRFYRCPWAKYEDAKPGSIKLMPPESSIKTLRDDYKHMQSMFYGDIPTFEQVMESIQALEAEINR